MAGSRERYRDPAIVFSRTRPKQARVIVFAFPPVGQFSSSPPHGVNIFPTTRPHVSGQCPAPRSGVRNVHHTSVLFPGRVRPGLRPVGAHTPAGYTDKSPRGSTAESDSRWQFPITVAFPIPRALSTLQRGRWNVPAHHHATVGRHGHTRTVVPSRRTVRDLDDQPGGGDRPRRSGQPARGPFHPVDHQCLRTGLGTNDHQGYR